MKYKKGVKPTARRPNVNEKIEVITNFTYTQKKKNKIMQFIKF